MYGQSAKKSGGHYRQVGAINGGLTVFDAKPVDIIPLSPNIHMQILQTDLYTFPLRISWENLIKDHHGILSLIIIKLILITLSLDNVWILLGENWFWSLMWLKGLIQAHIVKNKVKTEHSSHAVFCLMFFCSNFTPISHRTNLQISYRYIPFSFSFILSFISFLL